MEARDDLFFTSNNAHSFSSHCEQILHICVQSLLKTDAREVLLICRTHDLVRFRFATDVDAQSAYTRLHTHAGAIGTLDWLFCNVWQLTVTRIRMHVR